MRYVVSDLASAFRLYLPIDMILLYRPGQSTEAQQAINTEFIATLPSHLAGFTMPEYSCICGNGDQKCAAAPERYHATSRPSLSQLGGRT